MPPQIIFSPTDVFNHRLQRAHRKVIAHAVVYNDYSPSIGLTVNMVTAPLVWWVRSSWNKSRHGEDAGFLARQTRAGMTGPLVLCLQCCTVASASYSSNLRLTTLVLTSLNASARNALMSARAAGTPPSSAHTLIATAGVGHSTAPAAGSMGIGWPASRRSST
jgi:hypothetical protein